MPSLGAVAADAVNTAGSIPSAIISTRKSTRERLPPMKNYILKSGVNARFLGMTGGATKRNWVDFPVFLKYTFLCVRVYW